MRGDLNGHRVAAQGKADRGRSRGAVDCRSCIGVIGGGGHYERAHAMGHRGRIGQRAAGEAWAQAALAQGPRSGKSTSGIASNSLSLSRVFKRSLILADLPERFLR